MNLLKFFIRANKVIIFIILLIGIITIPILGDGLKKQIDVIFNKINVTINGQKLENDNILYNGTTYVPIRKIGEIFNKDVNWKADTNTVDICDKHNQNKKSDEELEIDEEKYKEFLKMFDLNLDKNIAKHLRCLEYPKLYSNYRPFVIYFKTPNETIKNKDIIEKIKEYEHYDKYFIKLCEELVIKIYGEINSKKMYSMKIIRHTCERIAEVNINENYSTFRHVMDFENCED